MFPRGSQVKLTLLLSIGYLCVMEIGVSEFAAAKGISRSRVLKLIQREDIKARKIGGYWVINNSELNYLPNSSRPFSPKMAKAFLNLLSDIPIEDKLDPAELARLKKRIKILKNEDDPSLLLRSWLVNRAQKVKLNANAIDLPKLRESKRLVLSGISNAQSKISDASLIEGYIQESSLQELKKKYLLVESENPNVLLHVVQNPVQDPLPLGYLLADLADHYGARERNRVKELVMTI